MPGLKGELGLAQSRDGIGRRIPSCPNTQGAQQWSTGKSCVMFNVTFMRKCRPWSVVALQINPLSRLWAEAHISMVTLRGAEVGKYDFMHAALTVCPTPRQFIHTGGDTDLAHVTVGHARCGGSPFCLTGVMPPCIAIDEAYIVIQ